MCIRDRILCVPNNGAIPGLLNTDIVEVTCDLKDGEMIPHKVPNPGELQMELIRRVKIYERLASEAIRTRSISKAIDCLMAVSYTHLDVYKRQILNRAKY